MNKSTYDRMSRLVAFALKLLGVVGIIFVTVFWALTQKIELAFLPFFGTMCGVGLGVDVLREIAESKIIGDKDRDEKDDESR